MFKAFASRAADCFALREAVSIIICFVVIIIRKCNQYFLISELFP